MDPHGTRYVRSVGEWYDGGMKVETSVTLSPELIAAIDACAGGGRHRSELLEELAWEALRRRERAIRTERDIALINLHADFLNSEAEEFLTLQADVWADETDAAR